MSKFKKEEQIKVFNTAVSEACDLFIEAHKAEIEAKDVAKASRLFLAEALLKEGIHDKEQIKHEGYIITLKEGKVQDHSVSIKPVKD